MLLYSSTTFCVTARRVRLTSASASRALASATRRSGLFFSAISSICSSFDFAGASLSLAGGSGFGSGFGWALPAAAPASRSPGARGVIHRVRIPLLLLAGVFDRHEQPVVAGRDGLSLFGGGVEGAAVAAHGRQRVVLLLVEVGGGPVEFGLALGTVERLPLRGERRGGGPRFGHRFGRGVDRRLMVVQDRHGGRGGR